MITLHMGFSVFLVLLTINTKRVVSHNKILSLDSTVVCPAMTGQSTSYSSKMFTLPVYFNTRFIKICVLLTSEHPYTDLFPGNISTAF